MNASKYTHIKFSYKLSEEHPRMEIVVPKACITVLRTNETIAVVRFLYDQSHGRPDQVLADQPYSYFLEHLTGECVPQQPLDPKEDWQFAPGTSQPGPDSVEVQRNDADPSAAELPGTAPASRD